MMKNMQLLKAALSMLVITSLTGCAMFNKNVITSTRTTTIGQELADLQNAKESGAVTEEEYNRIKSNILKESVLEQACGCSK